MYVLTCMYDFVFAYVDGWMNGRMDAWMHYWGVTVVFVIDVYCLTIRFYRTDTE